jgi:hypothetical protein
MDMIANYTTIFWMMALYLQETVETNGHEFLVLLPDSDLKGFGVFV